MEVPGTALVRPSVLVMARSPVGTRVLVSVELLLLGSGSVQPEGGVTVAVLARLPVDAALMASTNWKLVVPLAATAPVV